MRRSPVLSVIIVLTSCSGPTVSTNEATFNSSSVNSSAAPRTAEALAAKAVTQKYFDRLGAGEHAQALALWSDDAAVKRAGVEPFVAANRALGSYKGRAGEPAGIRDSSGVRYALVEASARIVSPKGKVTNEYGVVMLKHAVNGDDAWRIWGMDLRPRHCRKGTVPQGLGCIKP